MALGPTTIKVKLRYPTTVLTPQPAGTLSIGTVLASNGIVIANSVTINATSFSGTAASSLTVGSLSQANIESYITSNSATAYANAISFAANASNANTGTLAYARLPSGIVNTSADFTISGVHTLQANLIFGSSAVIIANGSFGSVGQVLASNGTGLYWRFISSGLIAGDGLTSNATHYSVNPNTGITVNSSGVFVNSSYIATLSANNSTYLNGQLASYYTNATNISTGTLDTARLPATINVATAINIGNINLTTNIISIGNATVNTTINATSFSGIANNANNLGGVSLSTLQSQITGNAATAYSNAVANAAAIYQTTAGLAANVLVLSSNSAGFLGNSSGTIANIASWVTGNAATAYSNATTFSSNASNLGNGTVPTARLASGTANSTTYLRGDQTWATITTGGGLSAGNGLTSNATHYAVLANTGIVANSTGTFLDTTYTATLTVNAAGFLGNSSGTVANIASWVTGNAATAYTNATTFSANASNLGNGTVPNARLSAQIINTTSAFSISGIHDHTANLVITGNTSAVLMIGNNSTSNIIANSTTFVIQGIASVGSIFANSILVSVGNSTVNTTINATSFSGTANNANNLGGISLSTLQSQITGNAATAYSNAVANAAAIYQTTAGLAANVLVLTSNAAGFLGNSSGTIANIASWVTGNAATAYTNATTFAANASNLGNGTVPTARLASGTANSTTYLRGDQTWATVTGGSANPSGANTEIQFNDSGSFGASNNYTFDKVSIKLTIGNSTVNTAINSTSITLKSLIANGSIGTSGQVLTSNGTGLYWSTPTGGGLSAGNGLTSNATHYAVLANTGIVANSTGVFANTSYIDSRITASDKISSNTSAVSGSDQITNIITCSQAEYDGATKYSNTLYVIV